MNESRRRIHSIELQVASSQRQIDLALQRAETAVERWRSATEQTPSHHQSAADSIRALRLAIENHFDRLSGEGLLEDAVNQTPELYARFRKIEDWQLSLTETVRELDAAAVNPAAETHIAEIRSMLAKLRDELLSEEFEEQHIISDGLHRRAQDS